MVSMGPTSIPRRCAGCRPLGRVLSPLGAAILLAVAGLAWAPQAGAQAALSGGVAGLPAAGPASGGGVALYGGAIFPLASTPALVGGALPGGAAGGAYSQSLSASGGTPPYTYALSGGSSLPPGVVLSPSGGLSGTPTAAGTYSFTVQVTDAAAQTASVVYVITVAAPLGAVAVPVGGPVAGTLLALLLMGCAAAVRRRPR